MSGRIRSEAQGHKRKKEAEIASKQIKYRLLLAGFLKKAKKKNEAVNANDENIDASEKNMIQTDITE